MLFRADVALIFSQIYVLKELNAFLKEQTKCSLILLLQNKCNKK